ncbi:pentapeptide repeat-containing protein [Streptomyces sp. NPDC001928]|uniref:pentapeptide repeat-containing protein n=1 Tax=Streptomyces sp. NPDC001928 TaxID=3154404 RepID=UPI003328CB31
MTKRTTEQILRELLYLASPDSPEGARAAAAEAIARRGDEAMPGSEVGRLAEALRAREADGEPVVLRGADLAGANLYEVALHGADLTGADLTGADLSFSDLTGARLDLAKLAGAGLGGADLSGARLHRSDLAGAVLDDAVLAGAELNAAHLPTASLRAADLSEASLRGTVLREADLTGAQLWRAVLDFADLHGCDLTGADLGTVVGTLNVDRLRGVKWSTETRWPESQPGLGPEVLRNSVSIAPGIYQVGDEDSRDRTVDLTPSPRTPSPVS